jgi:hypothetical protein
MNTTKMNPTLALDEVLSYRHPGVVRRFAQDHHAALPEAEAVFQEMLKWLYLCYRGVTDEPEGFACSMTAELVQIDWMWHTFLLYTSDYADFCERYFGFFLHHVPEEDGTEVSLDEEAVRAQLQRQFALVYDVLGANTLTEWYGRSRYAAPGKKSWSRSRPR